MPECRLLEVERNAIEKRAFQATGLADAVLENVRVIYCRYPDICGAIAIVRSGETGDEYLTPLIGRGEDWETFPIETTCGQVFPDDGPATWATKGNSIVYLNRAPTYCGYFMHSTELFVLPDMDGNGSSELLLVSDIISILFSVELSGSGQYVLREVQSARSDL